MAVPIRIDNTPESPTRTAALRVRSISVAWKKFFVKLFEQNPQGVDGEVQRIEAKGSIFIPLAHRLSGTQCSSLPEHAHCSSDQKGHESHEPGAGVGSCCLLLERYPMSLHFDVPIGDPVVPALGDHVVVTIERRDGPADVYYAHGPEEDR